MSRRHLRAPSAVVAAIAITTSLDATGLTAFSALPLLPLAGVLWYYDRFSRQAVGMTRGCALEYLLAAAYPALVIGAITMAAIVRGAADIGHADWSKIAFNVLAGA